MNTIKILLLSTVLSMVFANFCPAQTGKGSTTGLAFLKLGIGGRASGLGEAYTAVVDDATATFWNPAGLSYVSRTQLAFSHTEWLQDISNEFLAFVVPAFQGGIGLSFTSNNVGGIARRVQPSDEPLGTVEAHDLALGISYGHAFNSSLRGGLSIKYLYEKIFIESTSGFALDFGVDFKPFDTALRFALVTQNLGSVGKLREESIDLPTTLRLGTSYKIDVTTIGGVILLAADGVKVFGADRGGGSEIKGNFGVEVYLKELIAFRFGYQTGFDDKGVGGGFGLNYKRYRLDYGYTPFNSNFGDTHRFSIGLDL